MSDKLINLGEVLTFNARKNAKVGQVYGFRKDSGQLVHYKVIRVSKGFKNVWAEKVQLYTPNEMEAKWDEVRHDKKD